MAHFAKIDENNIVVDVLVVPDEQEDRGQEYLNEIGFDGKWIQTSYNNNIRKMFAGIGSKYNPDLDRFEPAQEFAGWVWNEELYIYEPPFDPPEITDEQFALWNNETEDWEIKSVQD